MHGGVKVYRGSAGAARNYVEADRARVDDYYLAEGTGLAERLVATPDGVEAVGALDGDCYEAWVAGLDPLTQEPRGRLRQDASAVRFVEVVVNGPKTWSLAAALDPKIAAAYDAAQGRAAQQITGWLAQHATTRVGPRGRQVQVPVERIEAAVVRHYTSRAGDPHRHLHLQINARVWAAGRWRGLHTVGVRDMIDAINGIGHAAVMCDPQFRQALADGGFTLDNQSGEVSQLAGFVGSFSARARQIGRNVERYESSWRDAHPRQEPGPDLLRTWDRRAWSQARPDKVIPSDGTVLTNRWTDDLHDLGFRSPTRSAALAATRTGALDRDGAVDTVLTRLGAKRSAWNAADIRGQVELLIASEGLIADTAVHTELAEDLTARAVAASVPLLDEDGTPEHIRALTSRGVVTVEADLSSSFAGRASVGGMTARITGGDLDETQMKAVAALAGMHRLVVVEGAAGAGKTAALAGARSFLAQTGYGMVVVTPTLKAARVAETEIGTRAYSAAWLAHQYGFSWDDDGRWTREPSLPSREAQLHRGDLLLIDEERIGVGDRVATRRNASEFGVANRDTWVVTALGDDGTIHLTGKAGVREVPVGYARQNVELAYASTVYGAQGDTTRTAHLVLGEHTGAASAYVAMTRGREANTAHFVAENLDDARQQWLLTFARNRADLGPAHAGRLAAEEAAKYEPYIGPQHLAEHGRSSQETSQRPGPAPSVSRPGSGPSIGF